MALAEFGLGKRKLRRTPCATFTRNRGGVELLEEVSAAPMQMQNGRKRRSKKKGRTEARPYTEGSDG